MRYSIFIAALFLSTMFLSACKKDKNLVTKVPLPEGYFENDWTGSKTAAVDYDRKIFVQYYADWCSLCAEFKKDVLNDSEVEAYVKSKFVGALLDSEKEPGKALYEAAQITSHPASAMYNKDGTLLAIKTGKMTKTEFLAWIKTFE